MGYFLPARRKQLASGIAATAPLRASHSSCVSLWASLRYSHRLGIVMKRRTFLQSAAAAITVPSSSGTAHAQKQQSVDIEGMEALPPLPDSYSTPSYNLSPNYGSKSPPPLFDKIAEILLRGAPVDCRAVDVARYLYNVRNRILTAEVQSRLKAALSAEKPAVALDMNFISLFGYDWERNEYYNPLVVKIIKGTNGNPYNGDLTPWCASFVNWCIARSKSKNASYLAFGDNLLKYGSRSAASGSFRCWGAATQDPTEGDIVVYAMSGTEGDSCPVSSERSQGHVGFYVGRRVTAGGEISYDLLGGNQGFAPVSAPLAAPMAVSQKDIAQAISIRSMRKKWGDRVFHSFRTTS